MPIEWDERGWAVGRVDALPVGEAWLLLSPDPEARVDAPRWAHHARTFFRAELSPARDKAYPAGTTPICDALEVDAAPLAPAGAARPAMTRVALISVPLDRAPAARAAAAAAVAAIGGAGFDALLARARRLWQVRAAIVAGSDPRAPLAVAAVLASILLAPIVPPGERVIFGVKGARARLEAMGWRT